MCEPNCEHAPNCTEVDGMCFEGGNGCFKLAASPQTDAVLASSSTPLLALLTKWREEVCRLEKEYQFGRDGSDDRGWHHGKRDCLDECIEDLEAVIEEC